MTPMLSSFSLGMLLFAVFEKHDTAVATELHTRGR